jgi:hypothetical protein
VSRGAAGLGRRIGRLVILLVGTGLVVAAGAATSSSDDEATPGVVGELQGEVDAMVEGGLPADHPKVAMLQDEIDALVAGTTAESIPDPGAGGGAGGASGGAGGDRATTPDEAARADAALRPAQPAEAGTVECEAIPQRLGADEIAGATCVSVPQADGSSRYVAVAPAGEVRVVRFGPTGDVQRLPDRRLPGGVSTAGTELVPDAAGDLELRSARDGRPLGTLPLD